MKEWWCWKHTCAQTSCFLGRRVLCWADKRTWWASPGLTVACCSGGMLASANKQPIQNINSLLSWSTFHSIFLQWDVTGAEIKTRLKIKKDPKQKRHKYFNVNKTFNKSDNIHALAFSYQTNKQTNSAVSIHRVVAMLMQMYTWSNTACDKKKEALCNVVLLYPLPPTMQQHNAKHTSPCFASSITIHTGLVSEQMPINLTMCGWSNCCIMSET